MRKCMLVLPTGFCGLLLTMVIAGALGGLGKHVNDSLVRWRIADPPVPSDKKEKREVPPPKSPNRAGEAVANMFIGVLSALSIGFALRALLNLQVEQNMSAEELLRLIAVCILSGYAGARMLDTQIKNLLDRLQKAEDTIESTRDKVRTTEKKIAATETNLENAKDRAKDFREAQSYFVRGMYKQAAAVYKGIMDEIGDTAEGLAGLATCRAYLLDPTKDRPLARIPLQELADVIMLFDRALKLDGQDERSMYNRGCTKQAYRKAARAQEQDQRFSVGDVVADIEQAAGVDPTNWDLALADNDLEELWEEIRARRNAAKKLESGDRAGAKP
jgi:tetratricopeptide (TPR) repeat protein